ncbi:type I site-specific deoxyribonuclease [Maritalea myrionectae]|uniref:Type I site-specific deoxyribonuclease n=1 Tax=Maritalea myrionectae TaxID=454601 RepID=A0A2R4M9Q0_9HYPH|nr:restriction endonuclease subunit S [Maritalea myrionectae]AVX02579.1 type I site-specific deoxyribonuclease [Maritalea myrionectae]
MSDDIPHNWAFSTLGELVEHKKGKVPKAFSNGPADGFVPYIDIEAFETGFVKRFATTQKTTISTQDDVLLVWDGARFGLSGVFGTGALGSTLVRLRSDALERDYLLHFVRHHYRLINSRPRGTGTPHVEPDVFWPLQIGVPPIAEQQRIVERVETLFARLDKGEETVREVQKLLTRYRQSVLKSAVTGQLTADWRAQREGQLESGRDLLARILETRKEHWQGRRGDKKPVKPDIADLFELPEGWVWTSVDQILRAGLSNGRSVPDAEGEGFPVMRLTSLKDGLIDTSERKAGRWTFSEAEPYLIEQGDVLVSRGNGSKQLVGRGGLVADAVDPVAYPDTMIRIPISLEYLSPHWFVQLWNSPFMRSFVETAAKTTAGIYKINQGDIRSFPVPLPPLAEQVEIANLVSEAHAKTVDLERWCETELKRSASLRQSILKDAFAGKLVPQDPNDEPASDLLARIAAQKPAAKKTRRKTPS